MARVTLEIVAERVSFWRLVANPFLADNVLSRPREFHLKRDRSEVWAPDTKFESANPNVSPIPKSLRTKLEWLDREEGVLEVLLQGVVVDDAP